ncbi:cystathionine beta-lyase [Blyttiomyces sp. JEL0837]|nr:cystathionine beta-lyase [Blyttiomyces sp. JEL0837]
MTPKIPTPSGSPITTTFPSASSSILPTHLLLPTSATSTTRTPPNMNSITTDTQPPQPGSVIDIDTSLSSKTATLSLTHNNNNSTTTLSPQHQQNHHNLTIEEDPKPKPSIKHHRISTQCVFVTETGVKDPYGASAVPIYQTATFKQTSATDMGEYDYTRSGNPTRSNLESHLAKIMGAHRTFTTSSGMSALDTITRLVKSGEEIVAGDDLYGGTNRLLTHLSKNMDIKVHHVDTTNPSAIQSVLHPTKTRLVLLETPTNPCIKIADIPKITEITRSICGNNAIIVVDNTMMSPILMKPLELGADIEYHSGTKFLSGHHDLMAGVIAVRDSALAERIYFIVNATGCGLAPFDSFLLLRGVKTLSLRVERQQSNAGIIARHLERRGYRVFYPGLESHEQFDIHNKIAKGAGAVMSFVTGDVVKSRRIVEWTKIWGISVSFGCVNSLISMPCHMSHASIPAEVRRARGLVEDLVRLCVGIEDVDDLLEDLDQALDNAERGIDPPVVRD